MDDSVHKALEPFAGKRVAEKTLREILQIGDYAEYCKLIESLLCEGKIEPVKSSGSNGMNPPLFKRYRVIYQEESYDALIPEIRLLHSALNIEGYLNQPKKYKEHREWILPLDTWLKTNFEQLDTPVSINERSFQVFYQEKALKYDKDLNGVLNFHPGIRKLLNYYDTPEPFFTYDITPIHLMVCTNAGQDPAGEINPSLADNNQGEVNILISENKDTWYTLRKLLNASRHDLYGVPFHILLYGEGKKINRKYSTLTDFDEITLGGCNTKYYYFGDIDFEGISIFKELKEQNPALDIELMTPLYRKMLEKSKTIPMPATKEKQSAKSMDSFLSYFEAEEQESLLKLLSERRYIPQEILNYTDFLEILNNSN